MQFPYFFKLFACVKGQISVQLMLLYSLIMVTKLHWLDMPISGLHKKYNFVSLTNYTVFKIRKNKHLANMEKELQKYITLILSFRTPDVFKAYVLAVVAEIFFSHGL